MVFWRLSGGVCPGGLLGAPGCSWVSPGCCWLLHRAAECPWVSPGWSWGALKNPIVKAVKNYWRLNIFLCRNSIRSALVARGSFGGLLGAAGCLLGGVGGALRNPILKAAKSYWRYESFPCKNSIWSALVARVSFGGAARSCWVLLSAPGCC